MHARTPNPRRSAPPLVAFRAALEPSTDSPALVELPGQRRPRARPAEQAALERGYARLPRRILLAAAACLLVALAFGTWMFSGGAM